MHKLIIGALLFISTYTRGDTKPSTDLLKMVNSIQNLNRPSEACEPAQMVRATSSVSDSEIWSREGFTSPKFHFLNYEFLHSRKAPLIISNQISLTALIYRNAGWLIDAVKRRLKATAKIFEQCGVYISSVTLVEADVPSNLVNVKKMPVRDAKDGEFFEMAAALPKIEKPVLFYFGNSADSETGYAASDTYVKEGNPLLNTIGISSKVLGQKFIKERGKDYMSEAHELGHLIGNWPASIGFGHLVWDNDNIMRGNGVKFNKSQCEDFKSSPLLKNKN